MSAASLPPSGDLPVSLGPKTCDARGMAEIHRFFKAGFGEAPALVAGVVEADAAHADVVGDHLAMLSTSLHAHHEGEDAMLWDQLEQRAPACALHVERMRRHHAELLVHLVALDEALPAWRAGGTRADAASVLDALEGVNAALAVHLPDEEANIVPVMESTFTQPEVEWFGEHGRKATPKGKTFVQLGAILAAQPDGGRAWMREHLPAPVRVIWRAFGRRVYEKNRAQLLGTR
ncbi:hemerythrin domain-containing protein [Agromyces salentinus]|uniref:Hemerythrin-like domain-containing protein n=1 Tax=Agromyces salentinus TaxID=269421 RepID=A0ABN2ML21_9MICO|nr:hemerythrin domain-containing protein [Agromyces salentinus]